MDERERRRPHPASVGCPDACGCSLHRLFGDATAGIVLAYRPRVPRSVDHFAGLRIFLDVIVGEELLERVVVAPLHRVRDLREDPFEIGRQSAPLHR